MTKRLDGKIALITGASKGIGAAIAKAYAKEGAHVILAARKVADLECVDDAIQQEGGKATLVPLDLLEYNKIDELGAVINERFGKLDILVGNAGILGTLTLVAHYDPKTWEKVINTNLTANYRLIRSMDPLLKASDAGRAIFVTSAVREEACPFWGAYAVSKLALEKLVETYAAEISETNIKANLVDPGVVATEMRAQAMPGEDPETLPTPDDITEIFIELAESSFNNNGEVYNAKEQSKRAS